MQRRATGAQLLKAALRLLQDSALILLDTAGRGLGSSPEEVALALIDDQQARGYADRYEIERPLVTRPPVRPRGERILLRATRARN